MSTGKRPSDEALRKKMNEVAGLLLDAHYGHLKAAADAGAAATLP
jgi:hypothetical protein